MQRSSFPTVLITGARAPVALHLARLFDGAGWRVVLADTPAFPLSAASRACASYVRLPPPRFEPERYGDAIETLVARENPALVVPTCEEIFYLAAVWRDRRLEAPLFAPDMDLLTQVHNKYEFNRLCLKLGLRAPHTILLESRDGLRAVEANASQLVFKPVWSRFASHVLIRPEPERLKGISPSRQMPWVAQDYLAGEEISAYAIARKGRLVAVSLYRSLWRAGAGAGICFEPIEDKQAFDFITDFVSGVGWSGQISFDLMRLPDGSVLPLECNPRAVSGLHFFRDPARFVDALLGDGPEVRPDVTAPQTVRLAMWIYGLPAALRSGEFGRFRKAMHEGQELLDWPGDSAPVRAQWPALAEIAGMAWRERISLQAASTRDIEWNGPADCR